MALQALCRILMAVELLGAWPDCIRLVLIVLLAKAEGGKRPIGLLPTIVRVWMRVRSPLARRWRTGLQDCDFLYGGAGRGAQRAAWMQAAMAERAAGTKQVYGAVLLDLVKAFEKVPHQMVIVAAKKHGYPLWLLRLSLDAYRMARTVVIDGACSRLVTASRGITAGSGFATEELCCLMLDVVRFVVEPLPCVRPTLYVDDLTL